MINRKGISGVITVLVSLLLVGVLSVGTLVIESGRFQAAKTQMAEASTSAATSMIAAYDAELYERYGLLAIDTQRFTQERAIDYLNFNSDRAFGYFGNRVSREYTIDSVELMGLYNLTYAPIMKRQILSRAKYRIVPQNYALNVNTMNAFFADYQAKCKYVADNLAWAANGSASIGDTADIPNEMLEALGGLYTACGKLDRFDKELDVTLSGSTLALLPSVTGTVENNAPADDIEDINTALSNAASVLGGSAGSLSYNNGTVVNEIDVSVSVDFVADIMGDLEDIGTNDDLGKEAQQLAGKIRALAQGFNSAINTLSTDKESSLLLNSYISEYFSNRNYRINTYAGPERGSSISGRDNMSFASACVEYVFGGRGSEQTNQQSAYTYIQAIRLIDNLYAFMTQSDSFDAFNLHSVAAHISWANYESILDTELMTTYKISVPFNKNAMILPINEPSKVTGAFSSEGMPTALKELGIYDGTVFNVEGSNQYSYKDMLSFALWFVPNTKKMMRTADLVQLEMRYHEQYVEKQTATFLMSQQNTYCRVKVVGKFSALLPTISLDSGNSMRGYGFQSIKYAGY